MVTPTEQTTQQTWTVLVGKKKLETTAVAARMSASFLDAVSERSAFSPTTAAAAACEAAAAGLAAGDPEQALAAAEYGLLHHAESSLLWTHRAHALNELQLHADVLASVPCMQAVDAEWQLHGGHAQAALQSLFANLPTFMAQTASSSHEEQLSAWSELNEVDPTSLHARSAIYCEWLQEVRRRLDAAAESGGSTAVDGGADDPYEMARHAVACLRECVSDARAFREAEACEPAATDAESVLRAGGEQLHRFLQRRRPNVPLAAYGEGGVDRAEAVIELNIGLGIELLARDARSAEPKRAAAEACVHYARSASLDGSSSDVFTLWGAAAERDASLGSDAARREAAADVWRRGVAAGIWDVAEQRPVSLIRGLAASAWHDPQSFAACRALEENFALIRAEALALLQIDAEQRNVFSSHLSQALVSGDWSDVGLYYNGMRNEVNAKRAPQTSALLSSDVGGLRRDCSSCPLGSAYFSLLRPHTRLAAHCGPTNARLRAHLGLVVPDGDCEMVVGGEVRRWVEGKVLLFDDSFEHAVHNETDEPRLILLVDLWHPQLQTDEERARVLPHDELRARYDGVVQHSIYEATTLRGH